MEELQQLDIVGRLGEMQFQDSENASLQDDAVVAGNQPNLQKQQNWNLLHCLNQDLECMQYGQ